MDENYPNKLYHYDISEHWLEKEGSILLLFWGEGRLYKYTKDVSSQRHWNSSSFTLSEMTGISWQYTL